MYYHVKATNPKGSSEPSNEVSSDPDLPSSPSLSGAVAGGGITVTWTEPADQGGSAITNYRIYRGSEYGYLDLLIEVGDVRTYVDEDVVEPNTYLYQISAVNAQGEGPRSEAVSVQMGVVPSAPRNLTAMAGNATISLTWLAPGSPGLTITSYRVYRGTTTDDLAVIATLGDVLTYTDNDVVNGITYHYKVSAVNTVGEGYLSELATAKPSGTPGAPINLGAIMDAGEVLLEWDPPASDGGSAILNYSIYRGDAEDTFSLIETVGNVTEYYDASAIAGQVYFYRVAALNGAGEGQLSNEVSVMVGYAPSAPGNLVATADDSVIILTWNAPDDDGGWAVTGYLVYRGANESSMALLASIGDVLNYTDEGIVAGQTYFYKVSAVNAIGEGPMSSIASAVADSLPQAPTGLLAVAGDGTIELTWQAPGSDGGAPITGYKVYRGTSATGLTLLATIGAVTNYTDDNVTNGQTYYYKVSAVNALGEGSMSEVEDATPVAEDVEGDDDGGNTMLFVIIAIVAIAAVAGVAVFLLKRKK